MESLYKILVFCYSTYQYIFDDCNNSVQPLATRFDPLFSYFWLYNTIRSNLRYLFKPVKWLFAVTLNCCQLLTLAHCYKKFYVSQTIVFLTH